MKSIVLFVLVAALLPVVSGAAAQIPDLPKVKYKAVSTAHIREMTALKTPPLRLPNIPAHVRKLQSAGEPTLRSKLIHSTQVLKFWQNRGRWLRAPLHEKCWEVPWQRSCTLARANHRLHNAIVAAAGKRLEILSRTLPNASSWAEAISYAQRPYPGTSGWLWSCSGSEGGSGGWVSNNEGSGAGGWMQFMSGTFWRMWSAAKYDVESRGFIVPAEAASWYSPLGQALAAAWGLTHGRSHEWVGSGC